MRIATGPWSKVALYVALTVAAFIVAFPILYAISISFMSQADFNAGALLPTALSFDNYIAAFERFPLFLYLTNSFVMSALVTVALLATSSLAAFAFSYVPFKGRSLIFFAVISTMMIPWEATIIVNFQTIRELGWLNTYLGLSVPYFALAFGIFLLRQAFLTLPHELYEATQVDGASRFRYFLTMVLPLARPMLATLAVYGFLTTWNKYLWPLLVTTNDRVRTVQIGIRMMQSEEQTAWPIVMAAVVLVILPTLLLLFFGQRQLKRGLISGGVKG